MPKGDFNKVAKQIRSLLKFLSKWLSLCLRITIRKNIFACLFSVHNKISLSRHEQVCLNILVHDVINLLY